MLGYGLVGFVLVFAIVRVFDTAGLLLYVDRRVLPLRLGTDLRLWGGLFREGLPFAYAGAMIGLFFTGAYILKAIKQVLHGPLNEHWAGHITEINRRELFVIVPLMVMMLWIGIWPNWILGVIIKAVSMVFNLI